MRRRWTPVVLAFLLLAILPGCLSSSDGDQPPETDPVPEREVQEGDPLTVRTVVHDGHGRWLTDVAYQGEFPVVEQRYVGPEYEEAGEPTLGVLSTGTAFYVSINPGFKPNVWRSQDLGMSWDKVTPTMALVVDYPPATNDPFVYADPLTDRIWDVDLNLQVDCSDVQWSDDEGETWARSTTDDCYMGGGSHDHQSLAAGIPHSATTEDYPNVVYYCVNRGEGLCYRSLDGGTTWLGPVATGLEFCGGLTGHVVTAPNGDAFLPQVACSFGDEEHQDEAWIAVSRDDGETWVPSIVMNKTVPVAKQYVSTHEASVAADEAGNVYYMFLDENTMPRLVVSHDWGRTWGLPINIARPGLTGATLVSITAGDDGRIAWLYVGTTSPGGHVSSPTTTWNAYVGYSLDADTDDPVFVTTTANPLDDPVKRGDCSGRCHGAGQGLIPGGMYDFLDITMDPATGRVWTALVDVCNMGCLGEGGTETGQIGRPAVGVQVGGTTLRTGAVL